MRMALNDIMQYMEERGADQEQIERARKTLPGLVETREYADTLRDLGIDVDDLTSADVPGPRPDDLNPEEEGPVGAPNNPSAPTA